MWCMLCIIYISNKSQYLKNEERYGKTIDGVPLSFQEFFQIDKLNFHFIYTLRGNDALTCTVGSFLLHSSAFFGQFPATNPGLQAPPLGLALDMPSLKSEFSGSPSNDPNVISRFRLLLVLLHSSGTSVSWEFFDIMYERLGMVGDCGSLILGISPLSETKHSNREHFKSSISSLAKSDGDCDIWVQPTVMLEFSKLKFFHSLPEQDSCGVLARDGGQIGERRVKLGSKKSSFFSLSVLLPRIVSLIISDGWDF